MKLSLAGLALAVALTTSGCGSSAPEATPTTPTPTPSVTPSETLAAKPATGPTIKGTGYTFRVPAGWGDVTKKVKISAGVDRAAGARLPIKGFASNVNVVLSTGGHPTAKQIDEVADQIRTAMVATSPHYRVLTPVTINGTRSAHLAGPSTQGKNTHWLEQYVVITPDKGYIFSFSFSPAVKPAVRRTTIDSILASWKVG